MNDIDLLRQQVLLHPDDPALLSAYEDELLAIGDDESAALVRKVRLRLPSVLKGETEDDRRCRLLYWMGLRPIAVADWLNYDNEGAVYPVDVPSQRTIGQAVTGMDTEQVDVRLNDTRILTDHHFPISFDTVISNNIGITRMKARVKTSRVN